MDETRARRQQFDIIANAQTVRVGEGDCRPEKDVLLPVTVAEKDNGVQKRKKRSGRSWCSWKSLWEKIQKKIQKIQKKIQSWKLRPLFLLYWFLSHVFFVFIFGVMWFCITIGTNTSGDVDVAAKSPGNGTDNTTMPGNDTSSTAESQVCMIGINDFSTATQFSFETQLGRKISAGKREVSEDCRGLSILVIIQFILGHLLNIFLLGVVFGKDGSGIEFLLTDVNEIVKGLKKDLEALKGVPDKLLGIQENLNIASQREHEAQNTIGSIRELLTTEDGPLTELQRSIDAIFVAQGEMKEQGQQNSQNSQNSLDRLQANSEKLVALPGNVREARTQLDRLRKMLEEAQKESGGQNAVTRSRLDDMQGQLGNLNTTVTNVVTNLNQMTRMVQRLLRSSNPIEVDDVEELHED